MIKQNMLMLKNVHVWSLWVFFPSWFAYKLVTIFRSPDFRTINSITPPLHIHFHSCWIFHCHVSFLGGVAEGILLITRKKRRWSRTGFLNCPRTVQKKPMGHNESPRSIAGLNGGWHDDDNIGCQPAIPRENKCLQKGAGSHARAAYTVVCLYEARNKVAWKDWPIYWK